MKMRPISEDAVEGPDIATSFAFVCAWANQLDLAFEQLNILIKVPGGRLNYGDLKTYPGWDPLRTLALNAGAFAFLAKPIDADAFLSSVRGALGE